MLAMLIVHCSPSHSRSGSDSADAAPEAMPSAALIRYLGQFSDADGAFMDPLELTPELFVDGESAALPVQPAKPTPSEPQAEGQAHEQN